MKINIAKVSAGIGVAAGLCVVGNSAMATVTPYSWIRGEAGNPTVDSSGNAKNFNAAFSSGCAGGAGGGGNSAALIVQTGVGGPLGPGVVVSTAAIRWGFYGCGNSGMWVQGPNNTVPPPEQWSLPAVNWVMEAWVLPLGDGASGGSTSSQFLSTGSGQFGGRPGGAAFRTVFENNSVVIRAHAIGPLQTDNFPIGDPVVSDGTRWIHVAVVNDNGTTTFYVNGVANGAPATGVTAPSGVPYIGSGQDTGAPFDGYLDEIRYSTFASGQFSVSDLLLRPPGPAILSQPQTATVWNGGPAPFEVQTAIDSSTTYQWQSNAVAIAGATGPEFYLSAVTPSDSGTVFNVLLNSSGVDRVSSNATLTVAANQTANVDFYRAAVNGESDLLAYFPVDDSSDTTVINSIGFAYDGTLSFDGGYDGRTNRAFGERALRFRGDNDVTIIHNPEFEFANGTATIEALVYLAPPAAAGNATIFALAGSAPSAYYQIQASLDGSSLVYKNDSSAQGLTWPAPVSMLGRFAHVAFVIENNTITAYLDGQSLGSKPHPSFGLSTGLPAYIGSSGRDFNSAVQEPWKGTIDELAVYGRALSANTIAVHNSRFIYGTAVTAPSIESVPTGTKTLLAGGSPVFRVRAAGTAPLSYQWNRNGAPIAGNASATTANLTLENSTLAMSGEYTVTVSNPIGDVTSQPFTVNFTAAPDAYSALVLADSPSAYWRMNETSGTTLTDSVGGLDGTYSSTVDRGVGGAPGVGDAAAHFRGSGSPVANAVVPFTPTLNPTAPFTIEFWAKPDRSGNVSGAVIGNQNRNTGRAGYAVYQGFNVNGWEAHIGFAETVLFIQGGTPPVAGRWDHVVVTWDGVNISRIYVNGRDDTAAATVNGPNRPNLSVPFEIGSRFGGGVPYPGTIDEVAFYNHALSPERINQHFSIAWVPAVIVQQPPETLSATEASTITIATVVTGYPNTYQWFKDGSPLVAATNPDGTAHFPSGVNSPILVISQSVVADSGFYSVIVSNPIQTLQSTETFLVVNPDTTRPEVTLVTADSSMHRVRVNFNRWVDPESAGDEFSYIMSAGVTVSEVVFTADPSVVDLVTTDLTPGTRYTVTISGVKDQRANHNEIVPRTIPFRAFVLTPGVLAWDFYPRIPGVSVENLRASPTFPNGVYRSGVLTNFSTMPLTGGDLNSNPDFGPSNLGSDYGIRVYGWVTPPTSGNYTFFLRSDDGSELRLSSDSSPNTTPIASEIGCCQAFLEPGAAQTSEPKALVGGQNYFVEVLNKEGGGGDFVEVAWRLEGDPTAAASLRPIPGSALSAYAPLPAPRFGPVVINAGLLTLTWTGVGTLQESTEFTTWTDVPGNPASGFVVTPGTAHNFYRLVQ